VQGCRLEIFDDRKNTVVFANLDSVDYERFKNYKWKIDAGGYARRTVWVNDTIKPQYKTLLMHRCVLGVENEPATDLCVDHINGDPIDNRKSNLRIVSYATNAANRHKILTSTGILRVTEWNGKYIARVRRDGIPIYLGSFSTPLEASEAVDHYLRTGRFMYPIRKIRAVAQRDFNGGVLAIYENCKEAAQKTGICSENINRVANHNRQRSQAGGFLWTYIDELEGEVS
jgi:hypothetical protein